VGQNMSILPCWECDAASIGCTAKVGNEGVDVLEDVGYFAIDDMLKVIVACGLFLGTSPWCMCLCCRTF